MKIKHLSDTEIQQYVLDQSNCEKPKIVHVTSCDDCKARADNYELLFSGLRQQIKPVFTFNLSELVLAQIAHPKPAFSREIFIVYWLALIVITSMVVSCYLFKGYFSALFTGFSTMVLYLAGIAALAILIFQGREIYKKYEQQINTLNSY